MQWLDLAALLLFVGYVSIQLRFVQAWRKVPRLHDKAEPRKWSVLIPVRNEAHTLDSPNGTSLLEKLNPAYQHFEGGYEVIVIDDHSIDGTADLARQHGHVKVLSLPEDKTGKKAALSHGISMSTGDWIATLDADVTIGADWLNELNRFSQQQYAVVGPVQIENDGSWFQRWQSLDFCGMMLITGASLQLGHWAMGNGANLAFAKTAFHEVGGYESPEGKESASGDDMVLLGKIVTRFPERVKFAKSLAATVLTKPQQSLQSFIQQRWRWSAKTGLNQQRALTFTLGWVWIFHTGLLLGIFLASMGLTSWIIVLLCWLGKALVDFVLLQRATSFFKQAQLLSWKYPFDSIFHALYVSLIGFLALLPLNFTWKGRKHRV